VNILIDGGPSKKLKNDPKPTL